ncbi:hypothetical protein EV359DRAFT_61274 [Lentinula novae-zelandiae]|nr:hypothetical protein EV359DRAFT_61274 [Lentinula novae-zelandiae]
MGAAFIGVICAASLYGVQDLWYIKCLASLLLDRRASFSKKEPVYFYVVTNFSNPTEQANLVWSILLEVLFNGLIGFLVQSFLTMRVWKSIVRVGRTRMLRRLKLVTWKDLTSLKSLSMTVNVLGAVSDVIIAAGLFYFLHRSRTGFKKSDTMISKLILIWGKTLIYVAFYFSLGRLYSNSLLATLNARKGIRGLNVEEGDNVSVSLQTFSNKLRLRPMRNMTMAPNQTNISIKVDTTQELVRDKATKEKDFEFDITDVGKSEDTQSEVV